MNIPAVELRTAEKKCNILAEIDEDFRHVIDSLERRFGVKVRVQIIRPVIGGGAGSERIIISAVDELDARLKREARFVSASDRHASRGNSDGST